MNRPTSDTSGLLAGTFIPIRSKLIFIPIRSKPFLPRPKVYKNDRIGTHNLSAFDFVEYR